MTRARIVASMVLLAACGDRGVAVGDSGDSGTGESGESGESGTSTESYGEESDDGPDKLDVMGPPECPDDPASAQGPCDLPANIECPFPSPCVEEDCTASCVDGNWEESCPPCDGDCPDEPPAQGAECDPGLVCHWDACETDNEEFLATCDGGTWDLEATLCASPEECGEYGEDMYTPCDDNEVCISADDCTWTDICLANPCQNEPFSCGCAGVLCGAQDCLWAHAGWVMCGDADASVEILAAHQSGPFGPVLDDDHVYWTQTQPARLSRVEKGGGVVEDEWFDDQFFHHPVIGGSFVYLADATDDSIARLPIFEAPLEALQSDVNNPGVIRVDEAWIYLESSNPNELRRMPLAGGPSQLLADEDDGIEHISDIVLDDTHLYVLWSGFDPSVARVPKAGGMLEVLASGQKLVSNLAVDDTHVYWSQQTGDIRRVPKAGGNVEDVVTGIDKPRHIVVDDTHVYWTGITWEADIGRAPKGGGAPEIVATGQQAPRGLSVDSDAVYWVTGECGKVARVAK